MTNLFPADRNDSAHFIGAAFGNPFKLLLVSLEAHFKAAGASFESVFVWFDSA